MYDAIKRIFDLFSSLFLLILLSPVLLVLSLIVYFDIGRPIFFQQQRPGLNGKSFTFIKFRTMKNITDNNGLELADEVRLSKCGKFLRKTSFDEFPQLINVIRGEMSLVGPRPLLTEYLKHYSEEQMHRHSVKPGITGWAQVNGRNAISWEEKFKLDIWYVENQSFWLDVKIIALTLVRVVSGAGVSQKGMATVQKFKGSR